MNLLLILLNNKIKFFIIFIHIERGNDCIGKSLILNGIKQKTRIFNKHAKIILISWIYCMFQIVALFYRALQ